jgi:uncharacterized protein
MKVAPAIVSPCIAVCAMDEASGWCRGCHRTIAEIAAWATMSEAERRAVMRLLPARRVAWRAQRSRASDAAQ